MPKYRFSDMAYNVTDKKMPTIEDKDTYIGLEHMDTGSLRITRWGSKVAITGQKLLARKGDVLFGRRNAYLKRAAIAPFDCIFSAHGMILRPKTEVMDERFFPLFIISDVFMNKAIEISVGSLSPTVNWGTLKDVEFEVPELTEQRAIADLLWEVEYEREALGTAIAKLQQCKDSYLSEMLSAIDAEEKSFDEVFKVLSSNSLSRNSLNNDAGPAIDIHYGDIHVVYSEIVDIKSDYLTYLNEDVKIDKIKKEAYCCNGDIIIADASEDTDELGKTVELSNITDEIVLAGLHTFLCRPKDKYFTEGFLGYLMNSPYVHDQIEEIAVGTKVYSITKKDLLEIKIPIPPMDDQFAIVKKLTEIDKQLNALKKHEKDTGVLFGTLLKKQIN